jgi:hypothetical protein
VTWDEAVEALRKQTNERVEYLRREAESNRRLAADYLAKTQPDLRGVRCCLDAALGLDMAADFIAKQGEAEADAIIDAGDE